jgi:uncharacterized membrane protein
MQQTAGSNLLHYESYAKRKKFLRSPRFWFGVLLVSLGLFISSGLLEHRTFSSWVHQTGSGYNTSEARIRISSDYRGIDFYFGFTRVRFPSNAALPITGLNPYPAGAVKLRYFSMWLDPSPAPSHRFDQWIPGGIHLQWGDMVHSDDDNPGSKIVWAERILRLPGWIIILIGVIALLTNGRRKGSGNETGRQRNGDGVALSQPS